MAQVNQNYGCSNTFGRVEYNEFLTQIVIGTNFDIQLTPYAIRVTLSSRYDTFD